jgi:signal transduction histidine kinase
MLENKLFEALLDVIPFKAYATDIKSFEVVYANKMMRENMYAPQESYCWEKVFGQEQICSWCSIMELELLKKENSKKEKHIIEFFDETDDKWLKSYDELMSWPDGRDVKYSILVDITDQKEIQGSMIKSHATMAMKNKQMIVTNKKLQITKLKLQKSVGEFEQLLNATMEGILIFENNLCKDINMQALGFFACDDKEKLLNKKFLDFVSINFHDIVNQNECKENTTWECELLREDNSTFPALIKTSILTSKNKVISIIDLTELKEKEKEIQEQKKMVSLGEMIGNIAHQWRQPLSIISTASTGMLLQKEYDLLSEEEFKNNCNIINDNAQYLSKTIEDFANFIKDERTKKVFNLKDQIDCFLHLVEGSIKNNDIQIIQNIQDNILIYGYENELTQCFINLFNNSKEAIEENTTNKESKLIFISTSTKNNNIIIKIKDNAGGIAQNILPRIFEPYFTTKHKSRGKGLGLHMTYNFILDGMKGTIEVANVNYEYDSKSHVGTEFSITLPVS